MKSTILKVLIGLLFLIIFNVLFFVLGGTTHSQTQWICYGFIHAAYLCLLATPLLCGKRKGETSLLGSLYLRALFYFFTELIFGCVFMYYNPESFTAPTIIQSIILAIFLGLQMSSILANDATKKSLDKQAQERIKIKSLAMDIKTAMIKINDPNLLHQMGKCYESLNSCSIESFPEAQQTELDLKNAVNTLCASVEINDTSQLQNQIKQILLCIERRNQAIRIARLS